jgi:hypothetical protein
VSLIGASFFKQKSFSDSGELQREFQLTVLLVHHALKDSNSRWPGQALRAPAKFTAGTTPISICGAKAPQQYPYCGGSLHESGQPGVDAIADPHALQRPSIEKSSWEILPQQFTVRLGTCVNAPRVPQSLLGAKRIQNIAREPFGVNRKGHFPQ